MKVLLLLAAVLLVSCSSVPVMLDAGAGEASCAGACSRLRALGCKASAPTPAGVSCEDVCLNVQASGVLRWDLACRASARSCDAIDACEAK